MGWRSPSPPAQRGGGPALRWRGLRRGASDRRRPAVAGRTERSPAVGRPPSVGSGRTLGRRRQKKGAAVAPGGPEAGPPDPPAFRFIGLATALLTYLLPRGCSTYRPRGLMSHPARALHRQLPGRASGRTRFAASVSAVAGSVHLSPVRALKAPSTFSTSPPHPRIVSPVPPTTGRARHVQSSRPEPSTDANAEPTAARAGVWTYRVGVVRYRVRGGLYVQGGRGGTIRPPPG